MSILGEFVKQPVEVEVYSIQFNQDMTATDQLQTAWQMISLEKTRAWDQTVLSTPYTALLTDSDRILVTTSSVTLPVGAPEGYRLNVANKSQVTAISVNAFSVPARGAVIVAYKNGVWIEEAKTNSVLIDAPNDQRVRTFVQGGTPWASYSVQVTVTTAENRTMQDEFIVQIEEY